MMIPTIVGPVDRSELKVNFEITETDKAFEVACVWLKGEDLVRRDVWINSKNGIDMITEQGQFGG